MISDDFKTYVAATVARHFENAPKPNGTTEVNRLHIEIRDACCYEMRLHIATMTEDKEEMYQLAKYAEGRAQAAIYNLFTPPARKPKRYK